MKLTCAAKWTLVYGAFLILAGVTGFLSNPEKAKTALISGGTFGCLSLAWGAFALGGRRWPLGAALATTGFLTLIFTWRSVVSWQAVAAGQADKTFAAALITSMLLASLALLPVLISALFRKNCTPCSGVTSVS
jgi:uncharacterized membrane protein (UPF0136 family)